jgi:methylglutaconyl-CoA hydratase
MTYTTLNFEISDQIALITLNRPEKRNAISPEMIADLLAALDEIEKGPARVAILTGAGKAFCAGMDLAYLQQMSAPGGSKHRILKGGVLKGGIARASDANLADARRIAHMFRRIWDFPKPLIAAVQGAALAGGCALATFADFTLATPEAKFGYTEVRIGFMPGIVAAFIVRQVGDKLARDILLSGRIFGAEEARKMGLVNEIVPAESLMERAHTLAKELIALSPTSLTYTKGLLNKFSSAEIERDIETSLQESARIRSAEDFREGLTAFLEKRKPVWTGR